MKAEERAAAAAEAKLREAHRQEGQEGQAGGFGSRCRQEALEVSASRTALLPSLCPV